MAGVTVKLASDCWPVAPAARIVMGPLGAAGTVTSAVHTPCSLAEALVFVGLPLTVTVMLSFDPKPEPLTLTVVPGEPLGGSRLKPAPSVKGTVGALAEVKGPDARRVCEPAAAVGTMKRLDHLPWASAETLAPTRVPSKLTVMPVSLAPKPDPVAVTEAPGGAVERSTESVGVTVKVACAPPVEEPEALTTWGPPATAGS